MHLRSTPRSLLGAALAATLLLASPASARPVDTDLRATAGTSSLAGTVAPKQDLRGEHARDAAITQAPPAAPKQDLRGEHARASAQPAPAPATPVAAAGAPQPAPAADTNGSRPDTWLIVAVGLAGAIVIALSTTGVVRARHTA